MATGWRVLGEGNANIVLTYCGDEPSLAGLALRYAKENPAHASSDSEGQQLDAKVEEEIWGDIMPSERQMKEAHGITSDARAGAMRGLHFISQVLEPHLGHFAAAGAPVAMPAEAAAALKASSGIDAQVGSAVTLMRNQASLSSAARALPPGLALSGSVLCLEIKPKWGFQPFSLYLEDGLEGEIKRNVPRFTLHQLLKREERLRKGKMPPLSGTCDTAGLSFYNPVDLMSGDLVKMQAALAQLLTSPSNNMRLFLDGALKFGGRPDAESASGAYGGVEKMEASELLASALGLDTASAPEVFVAMASCMMCQAGVFERVRTVQMLDSVDIEAALPLYARLVSEMEGYGGSPVDVPLSRLRIKRGHAKKVAEGGESAPKKAKSDDTGEASEADARLLAGMASAGAPGSKAAEIIGWDRAKVCSVLRDFLTSATVKDCGVMVAIQSVEVPSEQAEGLVANADPVDCFVACGKRMCVALLPPPHAVAAAPATGEQQQQQPTDPPTSGLQSLEEAATKVASGAAHVLLVSDAAEGAPVSAAYLFQVSLVDLDPKPASKIPHNWELDQDCVRCGVAALPLLRSLGYALPEN